MPQADDEEIVTYPFGRPEPPPRPPRRWLRRLLPVVVTVAVLAVAGGAVYYARQAADRDAFAVGDCAIRHPGAGAAFEKADCADDAAGFVLLAIDPDGGCPEVAGAEREFSLGADELCFGEKGVDPATAMNGARAGDCVRWTPTVELRVPCSSQDATHQVSRRLSQVPAVDAEQDCGDADDLYWWDWSNVESDQEPTQYDVVLCLVRL